MSQQDFHLYLASSSPRRRELLEQIGVHYRQISSDIDESVLAGESPFDYVARLALAKADMGKQQLPKQDSHPVLGADTAVVIDNDILGKPRDRAHALAMLQRLSGRCHEVYSAVALAGRQRQVRVNVSRVCFKPLSPAECEAYWATGEPLGKAGAYGIQGHAAIFIEQLDGSYSGVMGLPLFETHALLLGEGIDMLDTRII